MKQLMFKSMIQAEKELFAKAQAQGGSLSSDSEADDQDDETKYFQEVIDDYADTSSAGRFQKRIVSRLDNFISSSDSLHLMEWSKLFISVESYFFERLSCSKTTKYALVKASYLFGTGGQLALRIGNSSSVLERSFGDAVRSVANRRVQLRNDINFIFKMIVILYVFISFLYFVKY